MTATIIWFFGQLKQIINKWLEKKKGKGKGKQNTTDQISFNHQ